MAPPSSGDGASLVHSTTLVRSGSPLATPRVNGSPGKAMAVGVNMVVVVAAIVVGDGATVAVVVGGSPSGSVVTAAVVPSVDD